MKKRGKIKQAGTFLCCGLLKARRKTKFLELARFFMTLVEGRNTMMRTPLRIFQGAFLLIFFSAQPGLTQTSDEFRAVQKELRLLQKEIQVIKDGQLKIQRDLEKILRHTSERGATVISFADDPVKGDKDAKVTLVDFSDYGCPFCTRHARKVWPQIERDYVRTGKVKYVFMDFPLLFHKYSFKSHEAANCAGEQGKYWEMHDRIYAEKGSSAPTYNELLGHAAVIRLDFLTFKRCVDSGKHAVEINKDLAAGEKAGVKGTPTFFLGFTEPDDSKIKALAVIRGARPYSAFKKAIDKLLTSQKE